MNAYESKDFYLSAYLLTLGNKIIKHWRDKGTTTFVFEDSKELQKAITLYYTMQASVEPISYGNSVKTLKSIIYSYTSTSSNQQHNYDTKENIL